MDVLSSAFHAMSVYPQFIAYKLIKEPGKEKLKKLPVSYKTGHPVKNWITNTDEVLTYPQTALGAIKQLGSEYGLGFVFAEQDPFFFLDIDNCCEGGEWSQLSKDLISMFSGAAIEVSTSGKGLHIIGTGKIDSHSCRNSNLNIELYTKDRFVALTGHYAQGDCAKDCELELTLLVHKYFSGKDIVQVSASWWSESPVPEWNGPIDDEELIRRMLMSKSSKSIFGNGVNFEDLWNNNEQKLAETYPPNDSSSDIYNRSIVDAALAQHLAFWTGSNAERMLGLMMRSQLVRDKWDRDDYLTRTIRNACKLCKEWLKDAHTEKPKVFYETPKNLELRKGELISGNTILSPVEQQELYKGHCYICDENKILIPGGYVLDREQYNVMFGGFTYVLDSLNCKTTKNAWEAFTNSRVLRHTKVQSSCFRPDLIPGEIVERDGESLVNTYWPIPRKRISGDVSLFQGHLQKLFPKDEEILTSYLAALLQYLGYKFKWCPVIQGVEGNGKTLLNRIMMALIGRRYCQSPRADQITSKFNDWQNRTIFAPIEDIYNDGNQLEIIEIMKPMIDSDFLMIEPKGGKKIMRDICCNYVITTNHKDGLRKTRNDRRFAIFYTPQQSVDDLKHYGLDLDYFTSFFSWINKGDGLGIIYDYLMSYTIKKEYNPALGTRAPITSSNESAIMQGLGRVEQEIQEAIDQDIPGFRYPWVSSIALDRLLDNIGAIRKIPPNRRRELMKSIGYDWHPALKDGRVSQVLVNEGGRPRLYIRTDHPDRNIETPSQVIKAYQEIQK